MPIWAEDFPVGNSFLHNIIIRRKFQVKNISVTFGEVGKKLRNRKEHLKNIDLSIPIWYLYVEGMWIYTWTKIRIVKKIFLYFIFFLHLFLWIDKGIACINDGAGYTLLQFLVYMFT